ncbi:hypothetical protein M5D96_007048 [Drosophila gunungcola]|uniref:Uncharacterized protein n=1 Tax=Drosophila gunungcola TaxID=103775 RepID=A0A9P9YMU0_9MUSC|nr:hypothetical protein M5D96_007048 [Drosophila gunungcola]
MRLKPQKKSSALQNQITKVINFRLRNRNSGEQQINGQRTTTGFCFPQTSSSETRGTIEEAFFIRRANSPRRSTHMFHRWHLNFEDAKPAAHGTYL